MWVCCRTGIKWAALYLSFCSPVRSVHLVFTSCVVASNLDRKEGFNWGSSALGVEYTGGISRGLRGCEEEHLWSSHVGVQYKKWEERMLLVAVGKLGKPLSPCHSMSQKGLDFALSLPCPSISFALSSPPCNSIPPYLGWELSWRSGVMQPLSPEHFPNSQWNWGVTDGQKCICWRGARACLYYLLLSFRGWAYKLEAPRPAVLLNSSNKLLVPHSSCSSGGWGPLRLFFPFLSLVCCMLLLLLLPFPSFVSLCVGEKKITKALWIKARDSAVHSITASHACAVYFLYKHKCNPLGMLQ